ncbi:hypothetical protein [uncultured Clostridium sp.]|uniref:hypothetical protein n=1 Tax=uncultured Clostridium sp. TaxID=59620 RepID=UPI0026F3CCB9|nr:hypothetical protein [uncultured Clostridium sp.]
MQNDINKQNEINKKIRRFNITCSLPAIIILVVLKINGTLSNKDLLFWAIITLTFIACFAVVDLIKKYIEKRKSKKEIG